jgi:multicomponent K+:H+ antiporter subunit F
MLSFTMPIAFAMLSLALLLCLWRLWRGPSLPDRILALDSLYIMVVALLVLLDIDFNTDAYFEAAMLIALIGFISTVALCKYVLRGDIIE